MDKRYTVGETVAALLGLLGALLAVAGVGMGAWRLALWLVQAGHAWAAVFAVGVVLYAVASAVSEVMDADA